MVTHVVPALVLIELGFEEADHVCDFATFALQPRGASRRNPAFPAFDRDPNGRDPDRRSGNDATGAAPDAYPAIAVVDERERSDELE